MKTSVFKLVNWISKKNKIIYLFVGKTHQNLIKKLKNKTIKDDEINILKQHFQNYSLLNNNITDEDVNIIYENIFADDNIYTLKNKIATHINQINFDHIYLWGTKKLNNYEVIDILTSIFNSTDKLETNDVNYILENVFNFKLETKNNTFNIHEIYEKIINNDKFNINIPLELNYFDVNNNQKYIPSDPFKKIKVNNLFLDSSNNYNPIYKYKLDSFNIIKNKIKTNVINFTYSDDLYKAYQKKIKDNDLIKNGVIKVYFPYLFDLDEYDEYNETYEETFKDTDEIIRNFISSKENDKLEKQKSLVNRLHIKVYPTLINIKFKNYLINLEGYFNNFITDDEIPMIIYKKYNNNIYKINKNSLGNKNNSDEKKIDIKDLDKWTENINIIRKNEFLEFKIFFKNFNNINLTKYFYLLIFDNGRIDIIYDFKNYEPVLINDIIESFTKVNF